MGKRIWKKPGTKAYKGALQKSLKRMARDIIRIPESKLESARLNYLKNKSANVDDLLVLDRLLSRAIIKKARQLNSMKKKSLQLKAQSENIVKGIGLLEKQFDGREAPKMFKRLKNSVEIILNNGRENIRILKCLERNLPKEEAQKVKKQRQEVEKACLKLTAKIGKLEREITEMENMQ